MVQNKKGSRTERRLVEFLDEDGWTPMRAPSSGSSTDRDLPDVIFARDGEVVVTETKSSGGDPIYLDGAEIDALTRFGRAFGAHIFVSAHFDVVHGDPAYGDDDMLGTYFVPVHELHETPGGNYRVKKETALEQGTPAARLWDIVDV